ncbi:MAG: hypothetical protein JWO38_5089 [Gemmataceae bacterium]|nr:hypothetical protein [Gemmataceae bacterium]
MRSALVAGLVFAALPTVAAAQNGPYRAVVSDSEVRLRAGPSDKYPETGTLPRGTEILVHEESNGWLAVQAPGAVSWVPMLFIDFDKAQKIPQNVMTQTDVTLTPGRIGLPEPLVEVRLAKLPAGTILTVIGDKVLFDNKSWYPVVPPLGDFRYLPKTAVQPGSAVNTSFSVRDAAPPGLPPAPGSAPAPTAPAASGGLASPNSPAPKPVVNHPLWAQADEAEKAGKYDEAEKLLFQLARVMNEPGGDHDVANLCFTRIHTLREKKWGGTGGGSLPPPASGTSSAGSPTRNDRPTLLPPVGDDRASSTRPATPPVTPAGRDTPSSPTQPGTDRQGWSGMLRLSALALDGRQTYALESSPGNPKVYAVGAPGVDLKPFLNRSVELFGTTSTRKDLSKPYIVVAKVESNP